MKPPKLRLVKGFGMSPQEPDELEASIARFLALRSALTEGPQRQYRRVLGHFGQVSPDWPPTPEGIATFVEKYQHLKPDTIYTYFAIIRAFIRFCLKRRFITDDPLDSFSAPRRPGNLPRAPLAETLKDLTAYLEEQVEGILKLKKKRYIYQGWREMRNLCLFGLMLETGLRVSEAINIKLADIDLKVGTIFVSQGKGNKQREVPFGKKTRGDINLWLSCRKLIPITPGDPGYEYLFLTHRKGWGRMSTGHAEYTLERVCHLAGIPKITPHQLRHACASLRHKRGLPIAAIQILLGHTHASATFRYLLSRESLEDHLKSSPRDNQG